MTETLILESLEQKDRESYFSKMYRPEVTRVDGEMVAPAGFDVDDQLDSFDAFAAAAGGAG